MQIRLILVLKRQIGGIYLKKYITKEWLLFYSFIIISIVLMCFHEPWRDEAQVWLYVRDNSLWGLFTHLHFEGHPFVWFLLVFPLAKLGLPYASMFVLCLILSSVTVWLIAFKSPFHYVVKILIIYSCLIAYQYNIVARNYVLLPLFLVAIAVLFKERYSSKPLLYGILLALLANSHIFGALAVLIILFYDLLFYFIPQIKKDIRKIPQILHKALPAIIPVFIGFLVLLITLSGKKYFYGSTPQISHIMNLEFFNSASNLIYSSFRGYSIMEGYQSIVFLVQMGLVRPIHVAFIIVYDTIIPTCIIFLLLYKLKPAFMGVLIVIGVTIFSYLGTPSGYRHLGIIVIFIGFAFWVEMTTQDDAPNISKRWSHLTGKIRILFIIPIGILLLYGTFMFVQFSVSDITKPYSTSKETAAFIKNTGYDNKNVQLVTTAAPQVTSILPYLHNIKNMTIPYCGEKVSYMPWDQNYIKYTNVHNDADTAFNLARDYGKKNTKTILVILSTQNVKTPADFTKIYDNTKTSTICGDEFYCIFLYKR
jgi:hypothetical protein